MEKIIIFISILILNGLLFFPVFGAEIFFSSENKEIGLGQFKIDVILDTEGENVNAVEGIFIFPQNFLALNRISVGDSLINFWIQEPKLESGGEIKFSGIVPAGYIGKGKIFSAVFQALGEGNASLEFSGLKVLLNDGKGTSADIKAGQYEITINSKIKPEQIQPEEISDFEPPEPFTIHLANDGNIFGGKWFVVFSSQDKKSGIDRYEAAERRRGFPNFLFPLKWVTGESPYLLADQGLKSDIYIKAIDRAGNQRIQRLSPYQRENWYKNRILWTIIVIIVLSVFVVWRKNSNKK